MTARLLVGAGAVASLLAVSPVLEGPAARSFAWHMVQHQVFVLVAAPLLGAGTARLLLHRRGRSPRGLLRAAVLAAGIGHLAALLVWHVPPAYDAALALPAVHGAEHASLLGSGVLLWAAVVVGHLEGAAPAAAAAALTVVGLVSAGLGVVLLMAPEPLYAAYAHAPGAVVDQRVGGALMKVGGLVVHAGGAVWLVVRWLAALDGGPAPPQGVRA